MTDTINKIALVTGGSRGLGKDMALQLAKKGFDIILTYQTKSEYAQEVVNEINKTGKKAFAMQLDVANASSFDQFATTLATTLKNEFHAETLSALANNAGVGVHASYAETTIEQFDSMVNIHLKGAFFLTQKLSQLAKFAKTRLTLSPNGLDYFNNAVYLKVD
ncbi:MAG: SDR family NAD(P)-dependent oxidoreductase, partial [Flavobacteriaceae bacterium]|nr:SDR family NAD(P)-dependent oxidoreductase [Flavobacteriaceae bacterium]